MAWFRRRKPPEVRDSAASLIASAGGRTLSTWAGEDVTTESAQRLSAWWGCLRLLSDTVSTMPVDVVRVTGDARVPVVPTPTLIADPSASCSPMAWRRKIVWSLVGLGNAYCEVLGTDAAMRYPTRMEPIHPDCVSWVQSRDGWVPVVDGKARKLWPLGSLWHLPAFEVPGRPWGANPVEHAAQLIGQGLGAEKFGAQFFGDGGHPSAIVQAKTPLTQEQADAIKEVVRRVMTGNREPAVLGGDLNWQQVSVNPDDSQFLDAMRFTAQQVCGAIFGVPPEMLGFATSGESVTYANLAERDAAFLKYGLRPWVRRLEDALTRLLPAPQQVKLNAGGLLQPDTKTQAEVFNLFADIEVKTGTPVVTVAEMRAWLDLPPLRADQMPTVKPDEPRTVASPLAVHLHQAGVDVQVAPPAVSVPVTVERSDVPVTVHVPEQVWPAPVVNVTVPEPRVDVTVESPTVNVEPVINVEQRQMSRRVERDDAGNITRIVEEP